MGRCRRNIEITDGMCYIVAKQHISAFCLILPTINELIIMPGIMYNHTKYRYLELTDVNIDNSRNVFVTDYVVRILFGFLFVWFFFALFFCYTFRLLLFQAGFGKYIFTIDKLFRGGR
jgi:hypothetical protein